MSPSRKQLVMIAVAGCIAVLGTVWATLVWSSTERLELSGLVQAREVKNGSKFGGRVVEILVNEGDTVEKGQLLIRFDETELQSRLREAQAALGQVQAREKLVAQGADVSELDQASALVKQARQKLNMLLAGGRPEEVIQAQSRLESAQSQYEQAARALKNARPMLEEGIISQQKYDELQDRRQTAKTALESAQSSLKLLQGSSREEELEIARAQLTSAEARYNQLASGAKKEELEIASSGVEQARSLLDSLRSQHHEVRIKAPIAGQVNTLAVTEGELVPPGRPVVAVIDYENLWTDVYVPESKLGLLKLNKKVTVKAPTLKNARFNGKIALINPKSEFVPNSGGSTASEEAMFRVKIQLEPKDQSETVQLFPGMRVNVVLTR